MKNKNVFRVIGEITLNNKKNKFIKLAQPSPEGGMGTPVSQVTPAPAMPTQSPVATNNNVEMQSAKRPDAGFKKDNYASMQQIVAKYPNIYSNLRVVARKATEEFYMHWQQAVMQGAGPIYTSLRKYTMDIYEKRKKLEDFANKEYNKKLRAFRMIGLSEGGESQPAIAIDGDLKQILNSILSGAPATSAGMEVGEASGLAGIAGGGELVGGAKIAPQLQLLLGKEGPAIFDVETAGSMLMKIDQSLNIEKPERNKYGLELLDKMFDMWLQSFWAIYDAEFGVLSLQEMAGIEKLQGVGPGGFENPNENFMERVNETNTNEVPITNESMAQFDFNNMEEATTASLAKKYLKNRIFKVSQEDELPPMAMPPIPGNKQNVANSIAAPSPMAFNSQPQVVAGENEGAGNLKEKIRQLLDVKAGGYDKWINDHLYIPSMQERGQGVTQLIQDGIKVIAEHESDANLNIGTVAGVGGGGALDNVLPQHIIDLIYNIKNPPRQRTLPNS